MPQTLEGTPPDAARHALAHLDARSGRRWSQRLCFAAVLTMAWAAAGCSRPVAHVEPDVRIVADDQGTLVNQARTATLAPGIRHVRLYNTGKEPHEAMFVQLPAGMSPADYVAAVAGGALFPEGARDYSGPGLTASADSMDIWLPLDPGTYVLLCWNKDHATTLPPAVVTVTGAPHDAELPLADATITMREHHFAIDRPITAGDPVIEIVNAGRAMHELDILALHTGATLADLARWREGEAADSVFSGPAPATVRGGALDAHRIDTRVWIRQRLKPGRHALYCGMPLDSSAVTGQPFRNHADAGMVLEFLVR